MSLIHQGKPIVRDGLVFCIDPANDKSITKPIDINVTVAALYDLNHEHYVMWGKDRGDFDTAFTTNGTSDPSIVMFVGDTINLT